MIYYEEKRKILIIPTGFGILADSGVCKDAIEQAYNSGYTEGYSEANQVSLNLWFYEEDSSSDLSIGKTTSVKLNDYMLDYMQWSEGFGFGDHLYWLHIPKDEVPEIETIELEFNAFQSPSAITEDNPYKRIAVEQPHLVFNDLTINDYELEYLGESGDEQYPHKYRLTYEVSAYPVSDWGDGYNSGYTTGYDSGYTDGYQSGYTKGQEDCPECSGTSCNLADGELNMGADWSGSEVITPAQGYDGFNSVEVNDTGYGQAKYDEGYEAGLADCSGTSCNLTEGALEISDFWDGGPTNVTPISADGFSSFTVEDTNGSYAKKHYDDGYADGREDGYESGYTDGLSHSCELTSAAIVNVGDDGRTGTITPASLGSSAAGFSWFSVDASSYGQARYNSGYANGHNAGFNEGYTSGNTDGFQGGYQSGYTDGLAACSSGDCSEAIAEAYNSGQTVGYDSGYSAGYADGLIACSSSGTGPGNVSSLCVIFSGTNQSTSWLPPHLRPFICSGYEFNRSTTVIPPGVEHSVGFDGGTNNGELYWVVGSFPVPYLNVQQNGLSIGVDSNDLAAWGNNWSVYKVIVDGQYLWNALTDNPDELIAGGITLYPKTVTTSPYDEVYTLVNMTF